MTTTTPGRHGWTVPTDSDPIRDGAAAIRDLAEQVEATPLGLSDVIVYASSGTFTKANYPGLRAVRVRVQGAGGSGGGTEGGSGQAQSGGGGAGAYAESFLTADQLDDVETVTVGAQAPRPAWNEPGLTGGTSSFGSHAVAAGGGGGARGVNSTSNQAPAGGDGGDAAAGQLRVRGGDGGPGRILSGEASSMSNYGGASFLAGNRRAVSSINSDGNNAYSTGFGQGGGGAWSGSANRLGGAGGHGRVIVEVYR